MKNSLACCYLTHDHPDLLDRVLGHSVDVYKDCGIDICVFDDSEGDETKRIVENYITGGASNLYYIDAHEAENGNHKLFLVMNGYGLHKDYDYIWPVKDRLCFEPSFLKKICAAIDLDPDVILGMNEWQRWDVSRPVSADIYSDPAAFYRDYGFFITNWECTIRRRNTMLAAVDWDSYAERYDIKNNPFNQMLSLFVRASEIRDFRAVICRYDANERFFAGGYSSWKSVIFELWIDKWVKANNMLPKLYDPYKLGVIKDETNLKDMFGSVSYMMSYRDEGIYNRSIFDKYRKMWTLITDVPIESLELIADMEYEQVLRITLEEFETAIKEHDHLKARYLIAGNRWFREMYDEQSYSKLFKCYNEYTYDMLSRGVSNVFDGVDSIQDIINKPE